MYRVVFIRIVVCVLIVVSGLAAKAHARPPLSADRTPRPFQPHRRGEHSPSPGVGAVLRRRIILSARALLLIRPCCSPRMRRLASQAGGAQALLPAPGGLALLARAVQVRKQFVHQRPTDLLAHLDLLLGREAVLVGYDAVRQHLG